MAEVQYTKRELDLKFENLKQHITDIHNPVDVNIQKIFEMLEQYKDAKKEQNGRIGKLERWQSYVAGSVSILYIILVPAVGWLFFTVINHLIK